MSKSTPKIISDKPCECGCGQFTPLARFTRLIDGYIEGKPLRFCPGHRPPLYHSLHEAFWAHCSPGALNSCWEWQGTKVQDGYGHFKYRKKIYKAHRVSYEIHHGPIPKGLQVCHTCDNPCCWNPAHLWLGTSADNTADRDRKGRHVPVPGEAQGSSKLTDADVLEIRRLRAAGVKLAEIAAHFGIAYSNVSLIASRKTWRHLP